jgi:hypothetical protein
MQPMRKVSDDPVPHPQTESKEDGIQHRIEGNNGPSVNVISHLPANPPARGQSPHALGDDLGLLLEVELQLQFLLGSGTVQRLSGNRDLHA